MTSFGLLVAAVFLPLFPLSMLFNRLFAKAGSPWLRMALLLVWPQLGVGALFLAAAQPPTWTAYAAVLSAALYAFRALVVRDLGVWIAYMATSAWALLWPLALHFDGGIELSLLAAGFSLPLLVLTWLAGRLEEIFGAAYAGRPGGLAQTLPRLSALLVVTILGAVASPLFPGFFALLAAVTRSLPELPGVGLAILVVWLLWAWSGTRMTRGLTVGPATAEAKPDLGFAAAALSLLVLAALAISGVTASEYLL